jgi:hypothetical protein
MKLNKGFRPSPIVIREKLKDFDRLNQNIKNVRSTLDNFGTVNKFRPTRLNISK